MNSSGRLEHKGVKQYATNHPILVVRWQRRGGNEFIYLHFQKFNDRTHYSLWRRRAWTEGNGHVCHIPARWTRIHGVKRWSAIKIYPRHISLRKLRAARSRRRVVGKSLRW